MRGVEQHGVSGLQLGAEDLQQKIRADLPDWTRGGAKRPGAVV